MAILYEKKPIEYQNQYGIEEVKDGAFHGPCVLVLLASTWFLKSVNGAMRLVSNLVNPDIDTVYDSNKRIFGLGFGTFCEAYEGFTSFTPEEGELESITKKYFLPLVTINGQRIDFMDALKNVRNINIVTYCAASQYVKTMEDILKRMMQEVHYSNEEIQMILSQICLAAISGNSLKNEPHKSTTMVFGDIHDKYFELPFESTEIQDDCTLVDLGDSYGFIVNGDGNHDFSKYMSRDTLIGKTIKSFIEEALDNSIQNSTSDVFIPLDMDSITHNMFEKLNQSDKCFVFKKL